MLCVSHRLQGSAGRVISETGKLRKKLAREIKSWGPVSALICGGGTWRVAHHPPTVTVSLQGEFLPKFFHSGVVD